MTSSMRTILGILTAAFLIGCQAPITTDFHRAMTDRNGFVLDVHNESDRLLHCKVVTDDNVISHEFLLDPFAEEHIGLLQIGRSFKSGQHGAIEVSGYVSHSFTAPE
jgi:hypothetical protein